MRTGDVNKPVKGNHPFPPPGQPGRTRRAGIPWICNKHVYINSNYRCIASQDQVKTQVCKEEDCSNKCEHIGVKICLYLRNTSNCSSTCITWSHCNKWRKTSEVLGVKHRFINDMKCSISRDLQLACGHNERIFLQCYQKFNLSTTPIHRYESHCNDAMLIKLPWNGLELCEGKYDCNPPTTNYTNYEISYLCSANVTDICDDSVSSFPEGYLLSSNYPTYPPKRFTQCHCNMSVSSDDDDILLSLEINKSACRQSVSVWDGSSDNTVITEPAPAQSLLLQSSSVYISVTTDECHVGILRIHYEVLSKKISRPPGPVTIRCGDRMETTSSISTNGRSGTSARPEDDSTLQPRTSEDQSGSTALPTQLSETPKITTASSALINVTENTLRPEHGTVRIGSLDNLPAGEVASGVVGAVLFVICVILVTALLLRRKRRSPLETSNSRNHISANIDDVLVLGDSHINHDYASVNHAEMRDMEPYVNAAVIDGQLTDDAGQHPMNNQQASLRQEYPAPGVYDTLQGGAVDHVYTRIRNTQSVDYVDVSSDTTLSRETTTNNHHTEEYVNDIENAELE